MSTSTRNRFDGAENGGDQSPVDMWSPSKIRRPVSMYERNLSKKSINTNEKSPSNTEVGTIRHALKRYQSHLFELKEAKPPPSVEVPPVKVFVGPESPETPVNAEPVTLSVESSETIETCPAPNPAPISIPILDINHIPAYLSDPASALLMTAALNALTQAQAQIQVHPQNGQSIKDPMAAALAAASAQIIAATLIKPAVVAPVTPPAEASPPPPPPPAPVIIHMNSVSTETDIERPPSPVMSKELHDRMRRSGMTQLPSPYLRPGATQASFSASSSSIDHTGYNSYTSTGSSGSYQHGLYRQSSAQQHPQHHQDRQLLRPALPTSNSFDLPPSRTVSASSFNAVHKNHRETTLPAQIKKPPPTTVNAPAPPLPIPPQVSSPSLPANAGRSTSIEGMTGIASASANSPLTTARKAADEPSPENKNNSEASAPPTATTAVLTKQEDTSTNINNCSSNSFAHWPDVPASDQATPAQLASASSTSNDSPQKTLHSAGSDHSLLKSSKSESTTSSARNSRNLTFSDTINAHSETPHALEREQGAERDAFSPSPNSLYGSNSPQTLLSPSYKDFHAKYTNGLQAVQAVKSDVLYPLAKPSRAEKEEEKDEKDQVLAPPSISITSGEVSELDDNSRTNMYPSANSSPKNSTSIGAVTPMAARTLSRRDQTSATPNKNNNNHNAELHQQTTKASILLSPSPQTIEPRSMMDTLLQQTSFPSHQQEMQAQYKAPERVYLKQFHSVDPRVFEVEFEGNLAFSAQPSTPTRAQYRNSIMELIVATPDFVTRPSGSNEVDSLDADLQRAAFNASFMQSQRAQNNGSSNAYENDSEYDGSVIESHNEESKADSLSDLDVQSVRTLQSVHTVHTVHTCESSVQGVHPAQVNGCMIHKLLGTHSDYNLPVETTSRKSNKLITGAPPTENVPNGTSSVMDNITVGSTADISNFSEAIRGSPDTNEHKRYTIGKDNYGIALVDDDSIHALPPAVDTPLRSKSAHSRKLISNPSNQNNVSSVSMSSNALNPSMLQHTSSTRSVHRSFKYDDGMKKHILGRQTSSIKGQNKLHETALDFKQEACLNSIDAKNLKLASITNRNVLVGWQVLILKKGELSLLGLAVITGVRTNMFMQTEYRISSDVSLDCWVRLKRGKGMGGTEFQPLRKVLTTKQCNTKMRVIQYKKVI